MNQLTVTRPLEKIAASVTSGGLLQRKCACGNHMVAGGECAECRKRRLQRKATDHNELGTVPPIMHEVLRSPGQHLDATTRSFMEPRFGHDFSVVRVHADSKGTASMQVVNALAASSHGNPTIQATLTIGESNDPLEREADRVADHVLVAPISPAVSVAPPRIQRYMGQATPGADTAPASVDQALASPGRPLDPALRQDMEQRFGHNFSHVRVHTGDASEQSARDVRAHAYTVGHNVVFGAGRFMPGTHEGRRLLAHELTHVVQQTTAATIAAHTLQRQVILKGAEMHAKDRNAFLKVRHWISKTVAQAVMDDMASADDAFDFKDEAELEAEITKRTSTTQHMKESQKTTEKVPGDKRSAFGYPFTSPSGLYGPRVNYAARDYWQPAPPDGYAIRKHKAKNDALNKLPRGERCNIYGDQCAGYRFKLTAKGKADPYHSIVYLFAQQPPHKRTLIHCDYLLSLVNFMSFADSVGDAEFNKRVIAYGVDKISLRWNAFNDLQTEFFEKVKVGGKDTFFKRTGLGSLQYVAPTTKKDFVIGDHVVFFNHLAYDLLNKRIGNAWRLENAVLIGKDPKGHDIFLGHGSGRKTEADMRAKLAEEFNDVAKIALALVARAKSKDAKVQSQARADLATKFPIVQEVGSDWHVQGKAELCNTKSVNEKLRLIKPSEVLGPKDPCDPAKMYRVQRPAESAK